MTLEALRRAAKEYDAYIIRQHAARNPAPSSPAASEDGNPKTGTAVRTSGFAPLAQNSFTPGVGQQAIRALLHMLQFAVAYFIMLMAMYYNGYIIISIFIGSYIGAFLFSWQSIGLG
jgi:copper transporter 1